jgi:hypothetical protein
MFLVISLLLSTACGVAEGKSADSWPCVAVEVGTHRLTPSRVDSLRTQVSPSPMGAAGVRYATDILLAEWISTKQIGVMSDAKALTNYREVTRSLLARQGAGGLSSEFASAREQVGVRLSACTNEP